MNVWIRVAASAVALAYRAYFATLRIRWVSPDGAWRRLNQYRYGHEIFALCERDTLTLAGVMIGRGFTVLIAHGRDGDRASLALEALGCRIVRGSVRRGGARALIALIHERSRSAGPFAIVTDGPLGPSGQAKPGAVVCALRTGRPLRAVTSAARHQIVFRKTWSRMYLPLPFSRVIITLEEVPVPPSADVLDAEAAASDLSERLARARRRAVESATAWRAPQHARTRQEEGAAGS
jgi:lysophospholipid acyltransferase (LPLAT)-like uncharacterized protein